MKTIATVMQITRSLLILTPAEYDRADGGLQIKTKKNVSRIPTTFNVPQIFELNDSLKERPYEKSDELAAFVKRCAESVSMELGDVFVCIEDEDVLITKEYKHPHSKEKLLSTFAHVEAEAVLHADVDKYTILNFEYGQQYGKASKNEDISASLFAMNTGMLADIRVNFEKEGIHIVKITPPIAGLLNSSKVDLNSATKAIALISVDFAATRLVVLHNGAPIFQQSFSSVLEDIAELFSLEFGMSKMGAIDLIRQEGLGVCNKCHSAQTRKQAMTMLDNAAGEILRNLRMVISTQRLDIDQIVLCDALSKLPNIANYCRSVGLTAPMENVKNLFTGVTVAPTTTTGASEKGYDMTSFITMNGILTMPLGEANLILGESNIISAMTSQNNSKTGKAITAAVAVVAGLWMVGVGGWFAALDIQQKQDNDQMNSSSYNQAKKLIADKDQYTTALQNVQKDVEALPKTTIRSADVITEFFTEIVENVDKIRNMSYDAANSQIDTTFDLKDYNTYTKLKNQTVDTGYFKVLEAYSANIIQDQTTTGITPNTYLEASMGLVISDATIAKETAKTEAETSSSTSSTTESSSASSSTESSSAASSTESSSASSTAATESSAAASTASSEASTASSSASAASSH